MRGLFIWQRVICTGEGYLYAKRVVYGKGFSMGKDYFNGKGLSGCEVAICIKAICMAKSYLYGKWERDNCVNGNICMGKGYSYGKMSEERATCISCI